MELEQLSVTKLLDTATRINAMQKGFCDFCTGAFDYIEEIDCTKSDDEKSENDLDDIENTKHTIRVAFRSVSYRYRLKIRDEVKEMTGIELGMDGSNTIYDSIMIDSMSAIVKKIVAIVHEKRQEA